MPRTEPRPLLVALATLLLLAGSAAFAEHQIGLDASAMPVKDEDKDPVEEVGVDLDCAGGLTIVVTAEDEGALGNVVVAGYAVAELTTDALKRVFASRAAFRMGVFTPAIDGLVVAVDDVTRNELRDRAAARLAASGCTVGAPLDAGFGFRFVDPTGASFLATFAATDDGARVYIGH